MPSDFMTDPLAGLLPKPMDEMTDEELQLFVTNIRALRTSSQMLKAEMNQSVEKVKTTKEKKQAQPMQQSVLNNLLSDL